MTALCFFSNWCLLYASWVPFHESDRYYTKVLKFSQQATLAGPKHAPINLTMTLKTVDLIFVFQGFQGSISCDSYWDSTMHCLPVSNELLGTLLWINFHRCKCLLPMDFIVMTCVSWGEGEVLNSLLPPNEWFSFIVTIKCESHVYKNDFWLSPHFQGEALTSHYVSALTHWTY